MTVFRVRPSTIQIAGTLVAVVSGVIAGVTIPSEHIYSNAINGLIVCLLGEVLTFVVDIYYGPLGESRQFQDALKSSPVLKNYETCIVEYAQLRREWARNGTAGQVLTGWLDDKIRRHGEEAQSDWKHGRLSFGEADVAVRAIRMQQCVTYGGFATQLERNIGFWESADDYLEDTRKLARRGCNITRVFILTSDDSKDSQALRAHVARDNEAGIVTLLAYARQLSPDAIRDFGIWDDRYVCIVAMTPVGGYVTGSTYSMHEEDLRRANEWRDEIMRHAVSI
jgi:hypothetical protein